MASKRRNMFHKNKTQETTEKGSFVELLGPTGSPRWPLEVFLVGGGHFLLLFCVYPTFRVHQRAVQRSEFFFLEEFVRKDLASQQASLTTSSCTGGNFFFAFRPALDTVHRSSSCRVRWRRGGGAAILPSLSLLLLYTLVLFPSRLFLFFVSGENNAKQTATPPRCQVFGCGRVKISGVFWTESSPATATPSATSPPGCLGVVSRTGGGGERDGSLKMSRGQGRIRVDTGSRRDIQSQKGGKLRCLLLLVLVEHVLALGHHLQLERLQLITVQPYMFYQNKKQEMPEQMPEDYMDGQRLFDTSGLSDSLRNSMPDHRIFGSGDFTLGMDNRHSLIEVKKVIKCRVCEFRADTASEVQKHEQILHNLAPEKKKAPRPIPNLIPIQTGQQSLLKPSTDRPRQPEDSMTEKDLNDICAKSCPTSSLKDFASLIGDSNVFGSDPAPESRNSASPTGSADLSGDCKKSPDAFKKKHASFFDKLKEKLTTATESNLTCKFCGHEAKCLSELMKHQKTHSGRSSGASAPESTSVNGGSSPFGQELSSTRCQHCRHRCKTSADLINHLRSCSEAQHRPPSSSRDGDEDNNCEDFDEDEEDEDEEVGGAMDDSRGGSPHPMENKVFVWNMMANSDEDAGGTRPGSATTSPPPGVDRSPLPSLSPSGGTQEMKAFLGVEVKPGYGSITGDIKHIDEDSPSSIKEINSKKSNRSISFKNVCSQLAIPPQAGVPNGVVVSMPDYHTKALGFDSLRGQSWLKARLTSGPVGVYKCPHCNFWASTASRFHVHIVGHLNKRPFQCSLCCYSSNWRWDITKHIRLKSARDAAHSRAKVLLTDETGRRNYSKYNKYLTVMHVESGAPAPISASASPPSPQGAAPQPGSPAAARLRKILPKEGQQSSLQRLKRKLSHEDNDEDGRADDEGGEEGDERPHKKAYVPHNKKTMWKCKRCLFRDNDRNVVLAHVKEHYRGKTAANKTKIKSEAEETNNSSGLPPLPPLVPASMETSEKEECEEFMCETCPHVSDSLTSLVAHCEKHFVTHGTNFKCHYCPYYAEDNNELVEHMELHLRDEEMEHQDNKSTIFACLMCPYVTANKQQLIYHRKRHTAINTIHKCFKCTYAAPNNLILSLHARLHGRGSNNNTGNTCQVQQKDCIEPPPAEPISINCKSKGPADISGVNTANFPDIPMVWVSKGAGARTSIAKMFKCRYCPHVNMRKCNIQEHEKMHAFRSPTGTFAASGNHLQHRCPECNYMCNNAGILSSHAKVHHAIYGRVCAIADPNRDDQEQVEEVRGRLKRFELEWEDGAAGAALEGSTAADDDRVEDEKTLHFCSICPARFLYLKELIIHTRFHELKLMFKCASCSYTARQKQHLSAHLKVHTDDYQERTNSLCEIYQVSEDNPRPKVALVVEQAEGSEPVWIVVKMEEDNNNEEDQLEARASIASGDTEEEPSSPQKQLSCDHCPAKFCKSLALEYHLTLHGGPGPHKCKFCDYAVKTYGNLLKHEIVHRKTEGRNGKKGNKETQPPPPPGSPVESVKQKSPETPPKTPPKSQAPPPPPPLAMDPEFGILIHGSPEFIYPTYMKNGKLKEKRYKCHKCPSAFEKREQYKIHLSLHGSKQRYNCERCDYSVKYYANYSQHVKKHKMNDACRKERKSSLDKGEEYYEDAVENGEVEKDAPPQPVPLVERSTKSLKMSIADHQTVMLMQQRVVSNSVNPGVEPINRCPHCPYANNRKDGVGSHLRCHSATKAAAHTCKYCDYNVPQLHFLKDHVKVHFSSIKYMRPEAFMKCDRLELWAEPVQDGDKGEKSMIFKDRGVSYKTERYMPDIKLTRNGEFKGRVYINLKTGEEEIETDDEGDKENDNNINGADTVPQETVRGPEGQEVTRPADPADEKHEEVAPPSTQETAIDTVTTAAAESSSCSSSTSSSSSSLSGSSSSSSSSGSSSSSERTVGEGEPPGGDGRTAQDSEESSCDSSTSQTTSVSQPSSLANL
ncbi:hypothetical protein AAG570_001701 [Ranatra chinensis]|uniref:C2H2-type domain-containing protein n=1 Tax=Ranatra chinensis TaxID=642074 RepID=A0ABD0Y9A1_9HEMI